MKLIVERSYLVRRVQTIVVDAPEGFDLDTYADDWEFDQYACDTGEFVNTEYEYLDNDELHTRVTHVDDSEVSA